MQAVGPPPRRPPLPPDRLTAASRRELGWARPSSVALATWICPRIAVPPLGNEVLPPLSAAQLGGWGGHLGGLRGLSYVTRGSSDQGFSQEPKGSRGDLQPLHGDCEWEAQHGDPLDLNPPGFEVSCDYAQMC